MKYRVVICNGNYRSEIARVVSEGWAKSFAEDARKWIQDSGGAGISKVVVEQVNDNYLWEEIK